MVVDSRTAPVVGNRDRRHARRRLPIDTQARATPRRRRPASPGCGPGARPQCGSPGPSRPPRHDGGSRRGPFETSPPFRRRGPPRPRWLPPGPPSAREPRHTTSPRPVRREPRVRRADLRGDRPLASSPSSRARSAPSAAPSAPSRYGKRGQQVRRWLERRGRRAVRPLSRHHAPAGAAAPRPIVLRRGPALIPPCDGTRAAGYWCCSPS